MEGASKGKRYQITAPPIDPTKKADEEAVEREKLETHPDQVSTSSSIHPVLNEHGQQGHGEEEDMMAGIKGDIRAIKEVFAMDEVPREALYLGMAGVIPYLATSLTTVYLAWDINHADLTGHGFLLSGQTAEAALRIVEPLQVGYGAVIISFLGAIHWGLEWAKYGGVSRYKRYAYGVLAPAVAWPTMLLPVDMALISQFLAFTLSYFADSKAVVRGWAPPWYSTYRFVLTVFVGSSIVISLIGRGQIVDKLNRMPNPADRIQKLKNIQLEEMEAEERYKRDRIAEEDDESEESGEEEAEGEEEGGEEED
ncbi:uncharacterized protein KY384_004254 [Bacidia gigantensis]|uniref:uncharacterized protein n=1 Tax=Bacidia gigantensis TaxID=2732470 RepID=UPI001D05772C|nr:uncharacterized protein KY384_004254 [Bacidia gigantensis]KAG8530897.1 hypothetical protein KY384_004254 [Bacidia gigantensis]